MKKCVVLLLTLLLLLLPLNAYAAQDVLELDGGTVTPGETVYVTVRLKGAITGDSMGIQIQHDETVLEYLPEASFWKQDSILSDLSQEGTGVWAVEKPVELKDEICVLAFQTQKDTKADTTQVSCKLIIKNGAQEVGNFTAFGEVTLQCGHQFGDWNSDGSVNHVHSCALCGLKETGVHSWDDGAIGTGEHQGKTVYTCGLCKVLKVVDPASGEQEMISQNQQSQQTTSESPLNVQLHQHEEPTADSHAEHNHEAENAAAENENPWIILIITVGAGIVIAASIFFITRKKTKK